MRAVMIDRYGGPEALRIGDVARPQPKAGEILVRVRSTGVNPVDWKIRRGDLRPLLPLAFPYVLGGEIAGEVEAIGNDVSQFQPGDEIYAMTSLVRGGGYAEYAAVPTSIAARKPAALSFDEAAAVPLAGQTALQALRDRGGLAAGQSVLINGAAGGVGSFAVQLAKALGARVTGVCSAGSMRLVSDLGADAVIDYGREDFTRLQERYDIVLDAVAKRSFGACARILRPRGRYVTTLPGSGILFFSAVLPIAGLVGYGKRARLVMVQSNSDDLSFLANLADERKLRPVIDQVYALNQVSEAHARSESGHAHGKIVLHIA
jgi:NADPH:quinone reductase-like Zn-dependent oxidoreductase